MNTNSISQPSHMAPPGVAVLVTTHEPGRALLDLLEPLISAGTAAIIVVDDGSSSAREWMLHKLAFEPTVHLVRHSVPQGRGAALKTGIQYFLDHLRHYTGLVTVTADGEYAAADVLRVARALSRSTKLAIVAAREFPAIKPDGSMPVPSPSIADWVFRLLFRAFTGVAVSDVQTRLRALPTGLLPRLLRIPGNRFDYELATLFYIARSGYPLAEHAVPARLESRGGDPEFRPVSDTMSMLRAMVNSTPVDPFAPDQVQEQLTSLADSDSSNRKRSGAKQSQ